MKFGAISWLLSQPEFALRPKSALRLAHRRRNKPMTASVPLPWKDVIDISPQEYVGGVIWLKGVYELHVCETLWRLIEPGAHVWDIGANIGQMTSLMATRVGNGGRVQCFEPHPLVFDRLSANVARWKQAHPNVKIEAHSVALSNKPGALYLEMPSWFGQNNAVAKLVETAPPDSEEQSPVRVVCGNDYITSEKPVSLVKIDVEGHELAVFEGATRLFDNPPVRDIVFEDHQGVESPLCQFLEQHNYTLFGLTVKVSGLNLLTKAQCQKDVTNDYLATQDPERAIRLLSGKGWHTL